ncbi:hypothetical protein [Dyella sp. M7H15-1]|uniref:hypothetical protein n=1 Tax=Dyella sp. M7H15-1 TaxID=2501295 RepID=UPI00197A7074|nr:hypothetical protein [Dyella sp. M7H15-1]
MSVISTEVEFTLPVGYRDADGTLQRQGVMRMATAGDEILPLKDHRVQANPGYLAVIVLSRVIVKLGTLEMINTKVIEELFAVDFNYLQQLYNRINQIDGSAADAVPEVGAFMGKRDLLQMNGSTLK